MLHLSTIRQHFNLGSSSVVSLVDDLERQIEKLTLANQSPRHLQHLQQSISTQNQQIKRLSETIEHKSKELFKLHQTNHQLQQQLRLRISPTQPFINRLQNQIEKLQLQLSQTNQLNLQQKAKIREPEKALESNNSPAIKLDSHNLQQKISGCFRSTEGVKDFCRIRSYLSSTRKQGRSLLNAIKQTLEGRQIALTFQ